MFAKQVFFLKDETLFLKLKGTKINLWKKKHLALSQRAGEITSYNISLMLSKTNLTYSLVAAVVYIYSPKKITSEYYYLLFQPVRRYLLNESVNSIAFNFDLLRHVTIEQMFSRPHRSFGIGTTYLVYEYGQQHSGLHNTAHRISADIVETSGICGRDQSQ